MEQIRSAKRFGMWLILLTTLFRLFELGLPQRAALWFSNQYAERETGPDARSFSVFVPAFVESPPLSRREKPSLPVFTEADAQAVAVVNAGREEPDTGELIAMPMAMSLADGRPRVLILHTHTTESYTKQGEDYSESAAYRTLNEDYNMLSVGDRVTELLEAAGVGVIHDRVLHDYPSYTGSYAHARKSIQAFLADNPGIQLILDLHRDASEGTSQLRTGVTVGERRISQLMTVLGTGNASLENPSWQKNVSFALKLQWILEDQCPGICRPISLRGQRFNQDLGPVTLLVEVGAAGDTHDQALLAAEELAKAILTLQNGAA